MNRFFVWIFLMLPVIGIAQNETYKLRLVEQKSHDLTDLVYNQDKKIIGNMSFSGKVDSFSVPIDTSGSHPVVTSLMSIRIDGIPSFDAGSLGAVYCPEKSNLVFTDGTLRFSPDDIIHRGEMSRYIIAYNKLGEREYVKGPFNFYKEPIAYGSDGNIYLIGTFKRKGNERKLLMKINEKGIIDWETDLEDDICLEFTDLKISDDGREIVMLQYCNKRRKVNSNSFKGIEGIKIYSSAGHFLEEYKETQYGEYAKIKNFDNRHLVLNSSNTVYVLKRKNKNIADVYYFENTKGGIALNSDGLLAAYVSKETNDLVLVELIKESTKSNILLGGKIKVLSKIRLPENLESPYIYKVQFKGDDVIEIFIQGQKLIYTYSN